MAWERRKTGTYYYEKKRVNGKTVSIYWGNGELAREREQQIRLRRVSKRAKRVIDREKKELFDEVRSRSKQALRLLLDSVAQLHRLKGRRVPKLCRQQPVARAASPSVSRPAWPCCPRTPAEYQDAQSEPQIDTVREFAAQPESPTSPRKASGSSFAIRSRPWSPPLGSTQTTKEKPNKVQPE